MFKRVSGTYLLFSSVTIAILFFFFHSSDSGFVLSELCVYVHGYVLQRRESA